MTPSVAAIFEPILRDYVAALTAVANGDPEPITALCSHADDISQCGYWGGIDVGWEELKGRWSWVAAQFVPGSGRVSIEPAVASVTGAIAHGVFVERWWAHFTSRAEPTETLIRATLIFRIEDGGWKAIHRHGDSLLTKAPPN
jgi:hypothetical protein